MEETRLLEENEEEEKRTKTQTLVGMLNALCYVILMVLSTICVTRLDRSIGDFQLAFLRNGFGLLAFSCVMMYQRKLPTVPRYHIGTVILCCFMYNNSIGTYIAVTLVPVSSVQCIAIASGMCSGVILFSTFLSEKITFKNVVIVSLCVCGVIFVVQPNFLFRTFPQNYLHKVDRNETWTLELSSSSNHSNAAYNDDNESVVLVAIGHLLPILTGVMLTGEALLIKKYIFVRENFVLIAFWSLLASSVVSGINMAAVERLSLPGTWMDVFYILGQSIGYTLMWPVIYYAAKYLCGNTLNIVFSTSVVFFLVAQYTVLSSIHPGHRNWIEVLGVILILVGSSIKSILEFL